MKSLELNWIRKKADKSIVMPEVMFYPLADCAGKYFPPQPYEMYDAEGKPYWMRFGIIVVNPIYDIVSTIAHEWRHHWQYFNGVKFEYSDLSTFESLDYYTALIKYFTESKTELDALRFEYKHASISPFWEEPLRHLVQDLVTKPIISYGNNTTKNRQKVHSRSSNLRHSHPINKKTR